MPGVVPVGRGYLEGLLTWTPDAGAVGRFEGGLRPREDLTAFGFVEASRQEVLAGLGARWTFGL